jgi:hypothetical protein
MPVAEYLVGLVFWLGGYRGWGPGSDIRGWLVRLGGRKLVTPRRRIVSEGDARSNSACNCSSLS